MSLKISISFETLLTQLLVVRFLSSVNPHVGFKMTFLCKTLSTLRAGIRSISSVNYHVSLKVFFLVQNIFHTEGILTDYFQCEFSCGL